MLRRLFSRSVKIEDVPPLSHFLQSQTKSADPDPAPLLTSSPAPSLQGLKYFVETYGCQMNENDSEIVRGILENSGLQKADEVERVRYIQADVILLNTCAIRDKAERKVWQRLYEFRSMNLSASSRPTVAVLGCMAERLKHKLLEEENLVDIVAGPDSYRTLPKLLHAVRVEGASNAIDVQLSLEETYADIKPVRTKGISAYISIMRGCNNMCSFCVVPFTRGRERSRAVDSIMKEVQDLETQCVREITLLGQNVNSYLDDTYDLYTPHTNSPGFSELYKLRNKSGARFADLLSMVAEAAPNTRIRFTSPHPKDFPDRVLEVIKEYSNICKQIHLPLQSGSSNVLQRMRRGYTHEAFVELADRIRSTIPGVALSTDVIAGFCGETEEDHEQTLRALEKVQFEQAFMFAYSMRGKTHAFNNYQDDVPQEVKLRRLSEIIDLVKKYQLKKNQAEIGSTHTVLIEGPSKRDELIQTGRTDTNKRAVFVSKTDYSIGEYVRVKVSDCSSQTLYVEALG